MPIPQRQIPRANNHNNEKNYNAVALFALAAGGGLKFDGS